MKIQSLKPEDFAIDSLGKATIPSPLGLSTVLGDDIANYVSDTESVLYNTDRDMLLRQVREGKPVLAFEKAGPRKSIYFDGTAVKAAVVTCGGLCPGINNVIRSLVMELTYRYRVGTVYGIRYGFRGFIPALGHEPLLLDPALVRDIHEKGGSILASSRGPQDIGAVVDRLVSMDIAILFVIGGDGTLTGALKIYEEIRRRGLRIAVVGIPKTIDNDIAFVDKTFGLETAFSIAAEAIRSAHTEATGAPNGVGLVKVMGRLSGFIAANAALALNEVNFVLIPEVKFALEGEQGLFALVERRLRAREHAVIIVAEGAGQEHLCFSGEKDSSGNPVLSDIGIFLKSALKDYFKTRTEIYVNLKYIDPSYLVRSVAANAHDAIYCMQLAQNAVHAGMAGKTGLIVGNWNGQMTHVPMALATSRRKELSPEDPLWLSVLEATGQPPIMGDV